MVWILLLGLQILSLALLRVPAQAQTRTQLETAGSAAAVNPSSSEPGPGAIALDWVPPAMAELSTEATVKSNFTLDRTMLGVAAGLMPDSDAQTRHAIGKLDGVSVHLLRFGMDGIADEAQVKAVREAYHRRGWQHVVANNNAAPGRGPLHTGTTDVWVAMDGTNLRGAVVLAETPQTLTLVTVAGDLSPIDLLHLRGHFGIPRDIPRLDGEGSKTPAE
jgi:hypothetical protein